ncbi:glycoside hydrolase family 27 protein [Sphingomonas sp. Leaf17]|uniref:glycoside hydrolase family 27 protein n=1 Tax=Sphingomonas sp. Leaf17 TaxID=1735683 RepID=UPI000A6D5E1A|nr:glycoside hydrolase family 27 protein [Sphingomonas sp. Leaf17]
MRMRKVLGAIGIAAVGGLIGVTAPMGMSPAVAQAAATPQPLASLDGSWLVVPRRTPGSVAIGGIPRSFVLSSDGRTVTGEFRFNGWVYPIANMVARPDGFAFDLTGKPPFVKMRAKLSAGGRFLDVWIGDEVVGVAPFLARRVTPAELATVERDAPRPDNMTKLPLPALHDVGVKNLAPTPPMGWNSWNVFREAVDDAAVRAMADRLVATGLRDAGYRYVTIDDGWQGKRDAAGVLHPNAKFPDMKGLVDYIHARGLKVGIYSSPGPVTCTGYIGSHGHEKQDAKTYAAWGVDLLKYDWCSASNIYDTKTEMQAQYQKMGDALAETGRAIVYSLCQYGLFDVGSWGNRVGGHLWRTGGDSIEGDLWHAIDFRFDHNGNAAHAGPSAWNDADMMLVGIDGLTPEEYRTHYTLWTMAASPIILGNDLRTMTPATKALVANREVIAIDQDPLGIQGRRVSQDGKTEIWTKRLADGSTAVALFNRGDAPAAMTVRWGGAVGVAQPKMLRDVWRGADLPVRPSYTTTVPRHGAILLRAF